MLRKFKALTRITVTVEPGSILILSDAQLRLIRPNALEPARDVPNNGLPDTPPKTPEIHAGLSRPVLEAEAAKRGIDASGARNRQEIVDMINAAAKGK